MFRSVEKWLSAIVTLAALSVAVAVVHREYFRPIPREQAEARAPERITRQHWDVLLDASIKMDDGPNDAPVVLVEFVDLECPGCGFYHQKVMPRVREEFGSSLSYRVVHLPLRAHRFARHAAVGAECAAQQNAFKGFVDQVFQKQDSIGLKSWSSYARDAAVSDTTRFKECISVPEMQFRIDAGIAIAESLAVESTPTVIVNGWRFFAPPGAPYLSRVIGNLLAGRDVVLGNTGTILSDLSSKR